MKAVGCCRSGEGDGERGHAHLLFFRRVKTESGKEKVNVQKYFLRFDVDDEYMLNVGALAPCLRAQLSVSDPCDLGFPQPSHEIVEVDTSIVIIVNTVEKDLAAWYTLWSGRRVHSAQSRATQVALV